MLAVAGGKGGVGRTTTALGLAVALAGQRRRPLVVDADCGMPTLHRLADAPRRGGLGAVAEGVPPSGAASRSRRFPGVDVLTAAPGADVRRALASLPRDRPVVVDCPGGGGRAAALPLQLADWAVVVTAPTTPAVRDAARTTAMARATGATVLGAVLVGSSPPIEGVAALADAPVLAAVPPVDGRPLDDPAVRSAYDRLAAAVTDLGVLSTPGDGRPADTRTATRPNDRTNDRASNRRHTRPTDGLHGENA